MHHNTPTAISFAKSPTKRFARPNPGIALDTGILIVDHDRASSVALSFMLSVRGYEEIRAVRSAARAVIIAGSFSPGIVFLDIELANTDTLDLAMKLRKTSRNNTVRLIALTSTVEHPLREAARAAGFERFLVKPCEQTEVDKILRLPTDIA